MKVWLFMRIGYPKRITGSYLLAGKDYDRILGKEIYDEVVDFLRGVEGYGFDGIFFPEHHSRAANGLSPSPNLFVGRRTLAELFEASSQLIVYHFMFGPDWEEGCPSCSCLADHIEISRVHLEHHDVTFVAVSRAPLDRIESLLQEQGMAVPVGVVASRATSTTTTRRRSRPRPSAVPRSSTASNHAGSTGPSCRAPASSPAIPLARSSMPTRPDPPQRRRHAARHQLSRPSRIAAWCFEG